jgi:ATP-binding cassette subfamily C protein CydCD
VSGGERQRLGIARALLADRPILVLDEPTAHLDAATADSLAAEIRGTTSGRTALVVTHRPEQVAGWEQIRLGPKGPVRSGPPALLGGAAAPAAGDQAVGRSGTSRRGSRR